MSEWISVKDIFPQSGTPSKNHVIFYYNNEYHIGYFIGKREYTGEYVWRSHIDGYNCISDVSYWMPLPQPPKDSSK